MCLWVPSLFGLPYIVHLSVGIHAFPEHRPSQPSKHIGRSKSRNSKVRYSTSSEGHGMRERCSVNHFRSRTELHLLQGPRGFPGVLRFNRHQAGLATRPSYYDSIVTVDVTSNATASQREGGAADPLAGEDGFGEEARLDDSDEEALFGQAPSSKRYHCNLPSHTIAQLFAGAKMDHCNLFLPFSSFFPGWKRLLGSRSKVCLLQIGGRAIEQHWGQIWWRIVALVGEHAGSSRQFG